MLTYEILTENAEHNKGVMKALKALGYSFDNGMESGEYLALVIDDKRKHVGGNYRSYGSYTNITVDELIKKECSKKVEKVVLNGTYTAEVNSDGTITVGCQTFTHDAVAKLVKAIEKVTK